jgi:hypothetical protein
MQSAFCACVMCVCGGGGLHTVVPWTLDLVAFACSVLQVLVGTAKHKLWLYDIRAGRKPQSELVWGEGRITALLPQADGEARIACALFA